MENWLSGDVRSRPLDKEPRKLSPGERGREGRRSVHVCSQVPSGYVGMPPAPLMQRTCCEPGPDPNSRVWSLRWHPVALVGSKPNPVMRTPEEDSPPGWQKMQGGRGGDIAAVCSPELQPMSHVEKGVCGPGHRHALGQRLLSIDYVWRTLVGWGSSAA
ncbi:Hypothetical predicted protein [Marmota monax]|uniref:Uncharacterized protein n=1 Tax=Marmota monax TaxID=9995 RepID=A0A5E4CJE5_MARMO|nr:Hypothetical predicted protein [Marmota monax]